ncbi:MAG: aldo/keto reductase [Trueperaceae bacterium]|nr:aldo/keto reductase [Trueperaceae bacterium]
MIDRQLFGRTGHESSRTIFGAAALSSVTQAEADRTMELVEKHRINHIDTAASYGDAELRLAPWLKDHRKEVFLATKTGLRTYKEAKEQIYQSLERMGVEHIDLIQLHNLVDPEEWATALGEGGALQAAVEARDEGIVSYIGVTGHGLTVAAQHKRSLERFDFDSVLLPFSYVMMNLPDYARDFEALFALCQERNVAIQTIKSITRAPWGDKTPSRATWYEPLEAQEDIDKAVHWVLGRKGVFLNTVGDINVLPRVFDAAERFSGPIPDSEMERVFRQRQMEPLFTS